MPPAAPQLPLDTGLESQAGLVIETGMNQGAQVALVQRGRLVGQQELSPETRSAQGLLPAIDQLLGQHGMNPTDLRWLGLTSGPGSFTGLRVAITFAKMLALAGQVKVVAIGTCDVLERSWARRLELETTPVEPTSVLHTILDAQRGQLFARSRSINIAPLTTEPSPATPANETKVRHIELGEASSIQIVNPIAWSQSVSAIDWVIGPGLEKLKAFSWPADQCPNFVDISWQQIDLRVLSELAVERIIRGEWSDPLQLVPDYQRRSAAEEKRHPIAE